MKIEHVALYVNDLEKARCFFMKYLGARSNEGYHNLKTNFRSYFLSFDDGARLEIMNKPEMPDFPKELARTGYAHIAFSVGSKEKVDVLTFLFSSAPTISRRQNKSAHLWWTDLFWNTRPILRAKKQPNRSPTKWVRFGKEEQGSADEESGNSKRAAGF